MRVEGLTVVNIKGLIFWDGIPRSDSLRGPPAYAFRVKEKRRDVKGRGTLVMEQTVRCHIPCELLSYS
jgi:hypothetical protein